MLVIWLCGDKLCLLHRNLCLSLLFLAISPTTVYYKASIKLKPSPGADQSLFWWTLRCIVYIPESSLPDSKSAFGRPIYPFYPFPVISGHLIKNIKFIPQLMKPHMVFRFRVISSLLFKVSKWNLLLVLLPGFSWLKLSARGVAVRVSATVFHIIKSKSIYYRYYFD